MKRDLLECTKLQEEVFPVLRCNKALTRTILRLPVELLEEIFMYCGSFDSHPTTKPRRVSSDSLVTATHVCHHWRGVALRSPRLWCRIRFGSDWESIRVRLERSEDLPLQVCGDLRSLSPTHFPLFVETIKRAHSLFIWDQPPSSTIQQLSNHCPGGLVALHLRTYAEPLQTTTSRAHRDSHTLYPLLVTPALESATVASSNQLIEGMKTRPLSNLLTYLSLALCTVPAMQMGWSDAEVLHAVLNALRPLQSLRTLRIDSRASHNRASRNFATEVAGSATTRVALPNLVKLSLTGDLGPCDFFITRLEYPTYTKISTLIDGVHATGRNQILDAMIRIAQVSADACPGDPGVLYGLTIRTQSLLCLTGPWPKPGRDIFEFVHKQFGRRSVFALGSSTIIPEVISRRPGLFAVRQLHITFAETLFDHMCRALEHLHRVETLCFSQYSTGSDGVIERVLSPQRGHPFFPKLSHLLLDDCELSEPSIRAICAALKGRREAGMGIRLFVLRRCTGRSRLLSEEEEELGLIADADASRFTRSGKYTPVFSYTQA